MSEGLRLSFEDRAVTPIEQPVSAVLDEVEDENWPAPLHTDAFYGIAGEVVQTFAPYSEADPGALLIQFLVGIGNLIGPGPHFIHEADRHASNLFALLVGKSAKARKGTSWGRIYDLLRQIDPLWAERRISNGLSTGEGLIEAVRDRSDNDPEDPGVTDKRLLVVQGEFASVLKVMERPGNTLSPIIRNAYDNHLLSTLTRRSPLRATGAHISIVGHITRDELRRNLSETEAVNGFANRFLFFAVRRSKLLPESPTVPPEKIIYLVDKLKDIVKFISGAGRMIRGPEAKALWADEYRNLTADRPGLLGSITSRAEAHVARLSMIYALLDCHEVKSDAHLRAALSVWRYALDSATYIFGDSLGDPTADAIAQLLKRAGLKGLSRTEIYKGLGCNTRSQEIDRALKLLREYGRLTETTEKPPHFIWSAFVRPERHPGGGE